MAARAVLHALTSEGVAAPSALGVSIAAWSTFEQRHILLKPVRKRNAAEIVAEAVCTLLHLMLFAWAGHCLMFAGDPSCLLMCAAVLSLFAFALCWRRDADPKLSPPFLVLNALAMLLRLSCTVRYQAYLPTGASGDYPYQLVELGTAVLGFAGLLAARHTGLASLVTARWSLSMVGGGALILATQCYGDLASIRRPDQAFAASIYMEAGAWALLTAGALDPGLFGAGTELPRRAHAFGGFLPVSLVSAACRLYFWSCTKGELMPVSPRKMMKYFPTVIVYAHWVLFACVALAIGAQLGKRAPRTATKPNSPRTTGHATRQAPAAPPALASVPITDVTKLPVPQGCSHLGPISSSFQAGKLRVEYRCVANPTA